MPVLLVRNSQDAIFHFLSDTEKLLAFSSTYRVTIFFSVRDAVDQRCDPFRGSGCVELDYTEHIHTTYILIRIRIQIRICI